MPRTLIALVGTLALNACAAPPLAAPSASAPVVITTAFAPTPFTAEAIREGCPAGRLVRWRVHEDDAVTESLMRFDNVNATGTWTSSQPLDPHGPVGEAPPPAFATWTQLRDHARFPAELTEIERATIDAAIGRCDCVIYRVRSPDAPDTMRVFYFDVERPGPPVRLTRVSGGEETIVMEMLADTRSE